MKKLISILLVLALLFSFAACTQTDTKTQTEAQTAAQTNTEKAGFSEQTKQAVADFVTLYGKGS